MARHKFHQHLLRVITCRPADTIFSDTKGAFRELRVNLWVVPAFRVQKMIWETASGIVHSFLAPARRRRQCVIWERFCFSRPMRARHSMGESHFVYMVSARAPALSPFFTCKVKFLTSKLCACPPCRAIQMYIIYRSPAESVWFCSQRAIHAGFPTHTNQSDRNI